jgi:hypothetical protein
MSACPLANAFLSSLWWIRDSHWRWRRDDISDIITNRCKSQPEGRAHPCGFGSKCIRPDQLYGEPWKWKWWGFLNSVQTLDKIWM